MRTVLIATAILCAALAAGQNLAPNPGADGADGKLPGFALYTGAGEGSVRPVATEGHGAPGAACLEVTGWYHPPTAADTPANHTVNLALALAPNDGFSAAGALPGTPGGLYAVSFWYKGDLPSATVRGISWPGETGTRDDRRNIPQLSEPIAPGPEWKPFGATFRLPAGVSRFALQVGAWGREQEGYRLGKLYVDDVRIVPKAWPDGEMRAVWWWGPNEKADRARCLAEATAMLDHLQAAGFNTILLTTSSLHLAAVDRPELQSQAPGSDWDWFGTVLRAATQRGLQVHLWYSPWIGKHPRRSVELIDHPEWRVILADGHPAEDAICFVNPASRQYQLDLMQRVLLRYPELAGLHIEEPGHRTCHCAYCARLAKEWLGLGILADPLGSEPALRNLAAYMNGNYFLGLRELVNRLRPELWLSANGGTSPASEFAIARDWPTWSRRGYLDFYIPQIYTQDVGQFRQWLADTQEGLGRGELVAGLAVSWSGIYPRRQEQATLTEEVRAARQAGAAGFCVFRAGLMEDAEWRTLAEVIKEKGK